MQVGVILDLDLVIKNLGSCLKALVLNDEAALVCAIFESEIHGGAADCVCYFSEVSHLLIYRCAGLLVQLN